MTINRRASAPRRIVQWALWLGLIVWLLPGQASALGLGRLQVNSALNQRLDAEIELLSLQPGDLDTLGVQLATQSLEGNINARSVDFNYRIESRGGRHFIRLFSNQPIREPLLNFLVWLDWQQGRLLREVAIFLDPPAQRQAVAAPAPPPPPVQAPARRSEPAPAPPAATPQYSTDAQAGALSYGPIRRGETLWGIASRARPEGVGMQQMMQAIYEANPRGFARRSLDSLMAGVTLQIPAVAGRAPRQLSVAAAPPPSAPAVAELQPIPAPADEATSPESPSGNEPAAEDSVEVRLLPPEQAQPAIADESAVTGSAPLIASKAGRPKLELAGLGDLQNRIRRIERDNPGLLSARTAQQPEQSGTEVALEPSPASNAVEPAPAAGETPHEATGDEPSRPATTVAETASPAAGTTTTDSDTGPVAGETVDTGAAAGGTESDATTGITNDTAQSSPVGTGTPAVSDDLITVADAPPPADIGGLDITGLLIRFQNDPVGTLRALQYQPVALPIAGGLIALLLLLAVLLRRSRRRRWQDEDSTLQEVLATPSHSGGEAPRLLSSPTALRSGRLDRVDFLLAAGSYREAENLIRLALVEEPDNPDLNAKMLEVYYRAGNADKFAETAEALHQNVTAESDPRWQRALQMGRGLCPRHPLFAQPADTSEDGGSHTEPVRHRQRTEGEVIDFPASSFDATVVSPHTDVTDRPDRASSPGSNAGLDSGRREDDRSQRLEQLTFGSPEDDEHAPSTDARGGDRPDSQDERMDSSDGTRKKALPGGESAAEIKLDLATAYLDMKDKDGARDLLEEVLQIGNHEQQARARDIMQQL